GSRKHAAPQPAAPAKEEPKPAPARQTAAEARTAPQPKPEAETKPKQPAPQRPAERPAGTPAAAERPATEPRAESKPAPAPAPKPEIVIQEKTYDQRMAENRDDVFRPSDEAKLTGPKVLGKMDVQHLGPAGGRREKRKRIGKDKVDVTKQQPAGPGSRGGQGGRDGQGGG